MTKPAETRISITLRYQKRVELVELLNTQNDDELDELVIGKRCG